MDRSYKDTTRKRTLKYLLGPLSSNPPSKLNILWHNGDSLSMNSTQIGILKQSHKVRLCCFLKSSHCAALEPQICLEILCYFSHQPLKRQFPDQQLCALLVLSDFPQCHGSWPKSVGLLHSSGCRCRFPSCLCGQLLTWRLASCGLPCCLLRACHWNDWIWGNGFTGIFYCFSRKMRGNTLGWEARTLGRYLSCKIEESRKVFVQDEWIVTVDFMCYQWLSFLREGVARITIRVHRQLTKYNFIICYLSGNLKFFGQWYVDPQGIHKSTCSAGRKLTIKKKKLKELKALFYMRRKIQYKLVL